MKITIERHKGSKGKDTLRLVYYYGSSTNPDSGKETQDKKREALDLFLFTTPNTKAEKQHNKETLLLAESIKAKRIVDYAKGRFGLIEIPVTFPETAKPNLLKVNLTVNLDQLIKELAKHGYQVINTNL